MLHLLTNSLTLKDTTSVDIIGIKVIPMTFWTTIIQKAPYIKTIRFLEALSDIDIAFGLKPLFYIETEGILEKLKTREAHAINENSNNTTLTKTEQSIVELQ